MIIPRLGWNAIGVGTKQAPFIFVWNPKVLCSGAGSDNALFENKVTQQTKLRDRWDAKRFEIVQIAIESRL